MTPPSLTPPPGCDLVLTTDGVIAGVHFLPDDPPETIGRKVLRMNLSDLAAKGAQPIGFLMAIALPASIDGPWLAAFVDGLGDDARRYACPLLGGDTDHTPGLIAVSITAFGAVPHGAMVRRATAKPGDSIVVTGTIGDAALGVMLRRDAGLAQRWRLSDEQAAALTAALSAAATAQRARRRRPCMTPRRRWTFPTGLPATLRNCAGRPASGLRSTSCGCRFRRPRMRGRGQPALLETVLTGGDDYEIVLTLSPDKLAAFRAAAPSAPACASTEIGRVSAGQGARFLRDGKALSFARPSYSHF